MAFKTYGTTQSNQDRKEVDFDAMNTYVVETADLKERTVLVGVVAGIVDLGIQDQEDAEVEFKGTEEDEAAEIEKNPNTYFKDGFDPVTKKSVRLKCWPQKAQQSVAIAVDFPDVIVDKGQFFGESRPLPLRLWLGGSFYTENSGMIVARPTPLRVVNLEKDRNKKPVWSFAKNHLFYKMALAAKLVEDGKPFLPNDIDQLIGKSFQFEAQVYFKESKGKQYYTENVKFQGALSRGQKAAEIDTTFIVQFDDENDPEALKQLRGHVINTIKRAKNLKGSAIQKQLNLQADSGEAPEQDDEPQEKQRVETPAKPKAQKVTPPPDDDDDDVPF